MHHAVRLWRSASRWRTGAFVLDGLLRTWCRRDRRLGWGPGRPPRRV